MTKISTIFLPKDGTVSDGFAKAMFVFHRDWSADVFVQHERFLVPADIPGVHTNTSARVTLTWTPRIHFTP